MGLTALFFEPGQPGFDLRPSDILGVFVLEEFDQQVQIPADSTPGFIIPDRSFIRALEFCEGDWRGDWIGYVHRNRGRLSGTPSARSR